jgi:tRNA dimethylallyltransferase
VSERPKIVVITGPTASGKTVFALNLAATLASEIVSADSAQVYRYLDIGTAKPTRAERDLVPHHLVDIVEPDESYDVGRFRAEATEAIEAIRSRGRLPLVVGGTALYLKALLRGLAPSPPRDRAVRAELEARWDAGPQDLWEELRRIDPKLAARLHPNDRSRIVRGLEVWRVVGQPLSAYQEGHGFSDEPFDALLLGMELEKEELHRRIEERVENMFAAGWVAEVRTLLARGFGPELPSMQSIGYRELCRWLREGGELSEVQGEIRRNTQRLAKRQATWFRRMPVVWIDPRKGAVEGISRAKKFLQTAPAPI